MRGLQSVCTGAALAVSYYWGVFEGAHPKQLWWQGILVFLMMIVVVTFVIAIPGVLQYVRLMRR